MAETFFINVDSSGWTDVSGTSLSGIITLRSDNVVFYVQAESQPSSDLNSGHRLNPGDDRADYLVIPPEKIWARALDTSAELVVTPST